VQSTKIRRRRDALTRDASSTNTRPSSYESFKKSELEAALDEYLAEHSNRFASRSDLTGYYNSRSKALGSPVKRESLKDETERGLKVAKRRATKLAEEIAAE
jgi:hypothetical protein